MNVAIPELIFKLRLNQPCHSLLSSTDQYRQKTTVYQKTNCNYHPSNVILVFVCVLKASINSILFSVCHLFSIKICIRIGTYYMLQNNSNNKKHHLRKRLIQTCTCSRWASTRSCGLPSVYLMSTYAKSGGLRRDKTYNFSTKDPSGNLYRLFIIPSLSADIGGCP